MLHSLISMFTTGCAVSNIYSIIMFTIFIFTIAYFAMFILFISVCMSMYVFVRESYAMRLYLLFVLDAECILIDFIICIYIYIYIYIVYYIIDIYI